jgi:predicted RNase H-like nuclease (RuvC/YqgF family)
MKTQALRETLHRLNRQVRERDRRIEELKKRLSPLERDYIRLYRLTGTLLSAIRAATAEIPSADRIRGEVRFWPLQRFGPGGDILAEREKGGR